jgi:hypothetical protein
VSRLPSDAAPRVANCLRSISVKLLVEFRRSA